MPKLPLPKNLRIELGTVPSGKSNPKVYPFFRKATKAWNHLVDHYVKYNENFGHLVLMYGGEKKWTIKGERNLNAANAQDAYDGYRFVTEKELIGIMKAGKLNNLTLWFRDVIRRNQSFTVILTLNGVLIFIDHKKVIVSSYRKGKKISPHIHEENEHLRYSRFLNGWEFVRNKQECFEWIGVRGRWPLMNKDECFLPFDTWKEWNKNEIFNKSVS